MQSKSIDVMLTHLKHIIHGSNQNPDVHMQTLDMDCEARRYYHRILSLGHVAFSHHLVASGVHDVLGK